MKKVGNRLMEATRAGLEKSGLRLVHVVATAEPNEVAGPAYTVPRLCESLAALGHHVRLFTLGQQGTRNERGVLRERFLSQYSFVPLLARLGISSDMRHALESADVDVFHTHGLWLMPNVYPARAARMRKRPLVLSPRGMLGREALQFSPIKKKAFWIAFQKNALSAVSCLHATSEQEYFDIRNFGLLQPVAIVPNGIDLPQIEMTPDVKADVPTVISLGRIHPKKALDRLIIAWSRLKGRFPDWRLEIIGPSELGYGDELRGLAEGLGLNNVYIKDPVFGDEKVAVLASAELFVLSTLNENFAMTVAESLAAGTPVISTKGAPWKGLEENGCGWWIDHGVEQLTAALDSAMSLSPEDRVTMGRRGRDWMKRSFAWENVAVEMGEVYQWLRHGGETPGCVRVQ